MSAPLTRDEIERRLMEPGTGEETERELTDALSALVHIIYDMRNSGSEVNDDVTGILYGDVLGDALYAADLAGKGETKW